MPVVGYIASEIVCFKEWGFYFHLFIHWFTYHCSTNSHSHMYYYSSDTSDSTWLTFPIAFWLQPIARCALVRWEPRSSAWCLCRRGRSTHPRRWATRAWRTPRSPASWPDATRADRTCSPLGRSAPVRLNYRAATAANSRDCWRNRVPWYQTQARHRQPGDSAQSWCIDSAHCRPCPRSKPLSAGGQVAWSV